MRLWPVAILPSPFVCNIFLECFNIHIVHRNTNKRVLLPKFDKTKITRGRIRNHSNKKNSPFYKQTLVEGSVITSTNTNKPLKRVEIPRTNRTAQHKHSKQQMIQNQLLTSPAPIVVVVLFFLSCIVLSYVLLFSCFSLLSCSFFFLLSFFFLSLSFLFCVLIVF